MAIQLTIPDSIADALRLPRGDRGRELQVELAVALYARGILVANLHRAASGSDTRSPDKGDLDHVPHITSGRKQVLDDGRMDVLVGQERRCPQVHTVTSAVRYRSFVTELAAKRIASSISSATRWG